jgi:hypothetical protein
MAKKVALAKLQKMESRKLAAAARARAAAKQTWNTQQHTLMAGGVAYGIGFAENRGMALPTIDGVDPTILYASAAFAASLFIKDRTFRKIAEGITDGLLGVAAFKAGKYGFNTLFQYAPPPPVLVPTTTAGTAGWGEEIVETGAF